MYLVPSGNDGHRVESAKVAAAPVESKSSLIGRLLLDLLLSIQVVTLVLESTGSS